MELLIALRCCAASHCNTVLNLLLLFSAVFKLKPDPVRQIRIS